MAYDPIQWEANARRMPRRRNLAALMGIGIVAAALAPAIEIFTNNESPDGLVSPLFMMSLLLILSVTQSPFARTTWVRAKGLAAFDELERAALVDATQRAFAVVLVMLLVLFAWLWAASAMGWPMPVRPRQWYALGWAFLVISASLPVFFAELAIPFPPDAESDDEDDLA